MELYPASPREKKIGTALMVHRKKGATQKTQLSHFKDEFLQEGHKLPQGKALLILVLKSKEPGLNVWTNVPSCS